MSKTDSIIHKKVKKALTRKKFVGFESFKKKVFLKTGVCEGSYLYTVFSDSQTLMIKVEKQEADGMNIIISRQPDKTLNFYVQTKTETAQVSGNPTLEKLFLPLVELHTENFLSCFEEIT